MSINMVCFLSCLTLSSSSLPSCQCLLLLSCWVCSGCSVWMSAPGSTDHPSCVFFTSLNRKLGPQSLVPHALPPCRLLATGPLVSIDSVLLPWLAAGSPDPLTWRLLTADSVHPLIQLHPASLWAALSHTPHTEPKLFCCRAFSSRVPTKARAWGYI